MEIKINKLDNTRANTYKFSENKIFALKQPNPTYIFIRKDKLPYIILQNPNLFSFLQEIKILRSDLQDLSKLTDFEYIKFTTNKHLDLKQETNDCLLFAERISLNNPLYSSSKSIFRVLDDKSSRKFGVSDKQNMDIARYTKNYVIKKEPLYNLKVNPNIHDAYAIIPHAIPLDKGVCPYHAATVIFKDGETNITLEADSGIKTQKPIFDMYSTRIPKYTFYAAHMPTYLQFNPSDKTSKFKIPTSLYLKNTEIQSDDKSKKSDSSKAGKNKTRNKRREKRRNKTRDKKNK